MPSLFTADRGNRHHHASLSASAVDPLPLSTHDDISIIETACTPIEAPPIDFPPYAHPAPQPHLSLSPHHPALARSRTPDPPLSPAECAPGSTHVPLSRCSTAPPQDSFLDACAPASRKLDPSTRHIATATKLTRMGFAAGQGQAAPVPEGKGGSRFGIKAFFKGKA